MTTNKITEQEVKQVIENMIPAIEGKDHAVVANALIWVLQELIECQIVEETHRKQVVLATLEALPLTILLDKNWTIH